MQQTWCREHLHRHRRNRTHWRDRRWKEFFRFSKSNSDPKQGWRSPSRRTPSIRRSRTRRPLSLKRLFLSLAIFRLIIYREKMSLWWKKKILTKCIFKIYYNLTKYVTRWMLKLLYNNNNIKTMNYNISRNNITIYSNNKAKRLLHPQQQQQHYKQKIPTLHEL